MRIDAQSQTDPKEQENDYGEPRGRSMQRGVDAMSAAYNASLSPERDTKPTQHLHQYSLPQKQRAGAGMASAESVPSRYDVKLMSAADTAKTLAAVNSG